MKVARCRVLSAKEEGLADEDHWKRENKAHWSTRVVRKCLRMQHSEGHRPFKTRESAAGSLLPAPCGGSVLSEQHPLFLCFPASRKATDWASRETRRLASISIHHDSNRMDMLRAERVRKLEER